MSIIRGFGRQNRDSLTFDSKRTAVSNISRAANSEADDDTTPTGRIFRIAYRLALWAIRRAKRYTDAQISAGISAEAPARFHVETSGFQVIDANEDSGLFMTDLRYKSPSSLLDDPDWLTYGDSVAAQVIVSEGIWHHTFFIRLKYNVTAASKIRTRLRMRVYRGGSGIADDLFGESVMWWDSSYIWVSDYGSSWDIIAASIDYEAIDGDTFVPSLIVEGLPTGGEVEVYGYWCAHRVGSL